MNGGTAVAVDPARVLDCAIEALNRDDLALPLADVDNALRAAPQDPRLWHVKGLIHRRLEQRELALPALQRATEMAPAEPLIAHGYARTLLEAGLPSVQAFARAMKLAPSNPDVVRGMVTALVAEGRADDAIEGLEVALTRSPQWADGHALLSSLRWAQGARKDFTSSFDSALEDFPDDVELRREQIVALIHAEQWEEAAKRIALGRAAIGEHPIFGVNEAVIQSEVGNGQRADELFAAFSDIPDAPLQVRRVRHLLRFRRPEEASAVIEEWLYRPEGFMFWPYASIAWRDTDPARREWLDGDERFVGIYDIADRLPPLEELVERLRRLHTLKSQPLEQSLRGGTQTDGDIFQHVDPVLVRLREAIRGVVAEHAERLPAPDPRHPLLGPRRESVRFQGAWSVWLNKRGYHANHVHPAGWISSALYLKLPPDLGQENAGFLALGDPRTPTFQVDARPDRLIEPKPGRLVLFPSYMWHGTLPFGEGERVTVAFDVARGR
jgi:cytochrome c-type biogenesis protein CcmH/NrfG